MSPRDRQFVRVRARQRCEYCRFHEEDLPLWPFHLDHVIAEQHGGADQPENLAWSCQRCNLFKGTNLSAIDPDSARVVRLYHPRIEIWHEHFLIQTNRIIGQTPGGRATVWLLQMNSVERVEIRSDLMALGQWPPVEA